MPAKRTDTELGKLHPVLKLADDRFGPIKNIWGVKEGGKQPSFWIFHAELTRPLGAYFVDFDCDAWGASIDKSEALFKCLGEALERYCMNCSLGTDSPEMRQASDCSFLNELPRCAPEEKCRESFKRFDSSWNLTQVRVREVATDIEHWLPAQYVHFAFHDHSEEAVTLPHSSGSAFHESLHQAIWSGLCEVAERDAFSLFWLNQFPAKEISLDVCGNQAELYGLKERINRIRNADLQVQCFDITTDFKVPTVFSIVRGNQFPFITVGASCCSDPVKAICKSIDEALMIRTAQISGKKTARVPSFEEFSWISTLRDHADLYAFWKNTPSFAFFADGKAEKMQLLAFINQPWWGEPKNLPALQERCSRLKEEHGLTVLYSENTLEDVTQYGFGVKVIVPEMLPISVPESAKWLATRRLAEHAEKHSLKMASNPYPHPFP